MEQIYPAKIFEYKHRQGKEPSRDEVLTPIFFCFSPIHRMASKIASGRE